MSTTSPSAAAASRVTTQTSTAVSDSRDTLEKYAIKMSLASIKSLLSNYSPLSERYTSAELEKFQQTPLRDGSDDVELEAGSHKTRKNGRAETERKSAKIIDGRTVSDAIIGLSDGLTVPFALTAGLSALGDTKVVVFGGLAELVAGAISMGLGGYLGAKSEE